MASIASKLDDLIAATRAAALPLRDRWLDPESAAALLSVTKRHFLERLAPLPGFPQPLRVGHPRWKASEILEWAESERSKAA